MFYVSDIQTTAPARFATPLQARVYAHLQAAGVAFERVDTDEAISMADCRLINEQLGVEMVKTLLLCNRQQTAFYLLVTTADKPFDTKAVSRALGVARLSFAPADALHARLGTTVGAATVFGVLLDPERQVQVVVDEEVAARRWYGCSDGTTTGYLKLPSAWVLREFLEQAQHPPAIICL
ncbi:YbaK/EbsC family protein [Hymenobacter sp. B81]|uniref:YbaK/EbsC family protein n=1 Tax=Hymenobacter sp. B81 TaxID=3344878 RepID=UPI0037DC6916